MRKLIVTFCIIAAAIGSAAAVSAHGHRYNAVYDNAGVCRYYTDQNQDGICDHCYYTDENGDGVCDNRTDYYRCGGGHHHRR